MRELTDKELTARYKMALEAILAVGSRGSVYELIGIATRALGVK